MPEDTQTGAPAASDQQPQRGADGTTIVPASDQGSADGQQPNQDPVRDPVAKAVAEAEAKYRRQLREAEKKIADFEAEKQAVADAELSDLQREQKAHSATQQKLADLERTAQERIIRTEVRAAAKALGIHEELAKRILDYAAISYNDDGDPENIAALLGAAISAYQLTPAAQTQQQQPQQPPTPPQPTSVGANPGNPPRSGGNATSGAITREYVDGLTQQQYANLSPERRAEIKNWVAANPRH